jgi:hypothetical protein
MSLDSSRPVVYIIYIQLCGLTNYRVVDIIIVPSLVIMGRVPRSYVPPLKIIISINGTDRHLNSVREFFQNCFYKQYLRGIIILKDSRRYHEMSVNKKDLFDLIEQLPDSAQRSAYDYLNFLVHDHEEKLDWEQLSRLAPDSVPLSEEEKQQLNSKEGFITGEEVKREFNLQIDLP